MCNFAAELKYVANKEKLVDIQWDIHSSEEIVLDTIDVDALNSLAKEIVERS